MMNKFFEWLGICTPKRKIKSITKEYDVSTETTYKNGTPERIPAHVRMGNGDEMVVWHNNKGEVMKEKIIKRR